MLLEESKNLLHSIICDVDFYQQGMEGNVKLCYLGCDNTADSMFCSRKMFHGVKICSTFNPELNVEYSSQKNQPASSPFTNYLGRRL